MLSTNLNELVLDIIRKFLRVQKRFTAFFQGKRFYCNALNGTSDYNISINCDMTVSCSCADHDGTDVIGDLKTQSFDEIFSGKVAKSFRQSLANGNLPIVQCATCPELKTVPKKNAQEFVDNFSLPKRGIMVENTIACNLQCVSCTRSLIEKQRKKKKLSLEEIRKISELLKDLKMRSLYYFKLGEAFLSSTILDELKIIRNDNPDIEIKISSNGALIDTDEKREAALLTNRIRFSIDGNDQKVLTKYQRNGNFDKSWENMKNLVAIRNERGLKKPLLEWKYVVFNWNDKEEMLLDAIKKAREAKVDGISFWPTVSPFWAWSWRYHFRKYSKELKKFESFESDDFFVKFR